MGAAAAAVRLRLLYWLLLCDIVTSTVALPFITSNPQFVSRDIIINNSSGTIQIFDSTTDQAILQGPATDGSGTNFSIPAMLWLAFCFVVGIPMTIAGIRGWRITIGVGIGLPATVCCMAFLNRVLVTQLILISHQQHGQHLSTQLARQAFQICFSQL